MTGTGSRRPASRPTHASTTNLLVTHLSWTVLKFDVPSPPNPFLSICFLPTASFLSSFLIVSGCFAQGGVVLTF